MMGTALLSASCAQKIENPILATPIHSQDKAAPGSSGSGLEAHEAPNTDDWQRVVCVGGASASNLLTFTVESTEAANPSTTLMMDPGAKDYPLIEASHVQLLEKPDPASDLIYLVLTAKSLSYSGGGLSQASILPDLFWVELNRKMRTTVSRRLATLAPISNRLAAVFKKMGILNPARQGWNLSGNPVVLSGSGSQSTIQEISDAPAVTPLSKGAEFFADPLASEKGFLLTGLDGATGTLRKFYLSRASKAELQILPESPSQEKPWGGAALSADLWFWFESGESSLSVAFWSTASTGALTRVALPTDGVLIARSVTWKKSGSNLQIFYAMEDEKNIFFRVVSLSDQTKQTDEVKSISRQVVSKKTLNLDNVSLASGLGEITPAPRFEHALVLNLSKQPLSRVSVVDLKSGEVSVKARIACREIGQ